MWLKNEASVYIDSSASMPGRGKNIVNKPLAHASLVAKHILSMIYESVAEKEEEKQYEKKRIDDLVAHWRTNPLCTVSQERACTIRLALSGREFFVTQASLKRIGTRRAFHKYVRELLQLEKHVSLHLRYIGCRAFKRQWTEHCIRCDDSECARSLQGAILQASTLLTMGDFSLLCQLCGPSSPAPVLTSTVIDPLSLIMINLGRRRSYGDVIPLWIFSTTCKDIKRACEELINDQRPVCVERAFYTYARGGPSAVISITLSP